MSRWTIQEGNLDAVMDILEDISEFDDTPSKSAILQRLEKVPHLVLTAHQGHSTLGFKIGYWREGAFYSWLGAVKGEYRQQGVAGALAEAQEKWANSQGYDRIWMKTRNRFPEMLILALRHGFKIVAIEPMEDLLENRIILEKHFK
jgi:predicted GNAT superfamily acetyltransferase